MSSNKKENGLNLTINNKDVLDKSCRNEYENYIITCNKEMLISLNNLKKELNDIKKEKELIANTSIIRNNLKIKATINNAKAIIKIQEEHNSFSKYIWNYVNNDPIINKFKSLNEVPNNTPLAKKI